MNNRSYFVTAGLTLLLMLAACSSKPAEDSKPVQAAKPSPASESVEPAAAVEPGAAEKVLQPSEAAEPQPAEPEIQIEMLISSERGITSQNRTVVSAEAGDRLYFVAELRNKDGAPVIGQRLKFRSQIGNAVIGRLAKTADDGVVEFSVIGQKTGADIIKVTAMGAEHLIYFQVNEAELTAAQTALPENIEGLVPWSTLAKTKVDSPDGLQVTPEFPSEVRSLENQRIRLAGFMMPLEQTEKQKHFMLTANPPNCFFHMPGGPATMAEIKSIEGVEFNFDPVVVEGKLELVDESEFGIVYRLVDAKPVEIAPAE